MRKRSYFTCSLSNKIAVFICVAALACSVLMLGACTQSSSSIKANNQAKLEEYAKLVVTTGINVQDGDVVALRANVDTADFARLCINAAYAAGADEVLVLWEDPKVTNSHLLYENEENLATAPESYRAFFEEAVAKNASSLWIYSPDFTTTQGASVERIALKSAAQSAAKASFSRSTRNDEIPWIVVGYPNATWAKQVFPNKTEDEAISALLDAILNTVYVTGDGTAAKTWEQHREFLDTRAEQMNSYNFVSLRYTNSAGTDLTVQMPEGHLWKASGGTTSDGRSFISNMPTEEVYSAPLRTGVNGKLVASMPLVLDGQVVEDIVFTFEDGKIVDATASSNLDLLQSALDTDENSRYLGEISLVSRDSPIYKMGILFYNTLYDENASCHFAFGSSYSLCLSDGASMSTEELLAHGLNQSSEHTDFMVGTDDLSIIGTTADGREVVVFKDGKFAF